MKWIEGYVCVVRRPGLDDLFGPSEDPGSQSQLITDNGLRLFNSFRAAKRVARMLGKSADHPTVTVEWLQLRITESEEEIQALKTYVGEMIIVGKEDWVIEKVIYHLYGPDFHERAVGSRHLAYNGLQPYGCEDLPFGELDVFWCIYYKASEVARQVQIPVQLSTFRLVPIPTTNKRQLALFPRL